MYRRKIGRLFAIKIYSHAPGVLKSESEYIQYHGVNELSIGTKSSECQNGRPGMQRKYMGGHEPNLGTPIGQQRRFRVYQTGRP
jgi:hypothetical protein